MNKKEFTDYNVLKAFVDPMVAEKKWALDVRQNTKTGIYTAYWIEHKNYTAQDGTVYADEVWVDYDGNMTCIQDLEPEHARNILRKLLAQEREAAATLEKLARQLIMDVEDVSPPLGAEPSTKPVLH